MRRLPCDLQAGHHRQTQPRSSCRAVHRQPSLDPNDASTRVDRRQIPKSCWGTQPPRINPLLAPRPAMPTINDGHDALRAATARSSPIMAPISAHPARQWCAEHSTDVDSCRYQPDQPTTCLCCSIWYRHASLMQPKSAPDSGPFTLRPDPNPPLGSRLTSSRIAAKTRNHMAASSECGEAQQHPYLYLRPLLPPQVGGSAGCASTGLRVQ